MTINISEEDVIKPYNNYLNNFNDIQNKYWDVWSHKLTHRIVGIRNGITQSTTKLNSWQNYNYGFIILSAIIPILVDIIKTQQSLSNFALLLNAVFPSIVGIVQKKREGWSKIKTVFTSISTSYDRLLWDIIVDIDRDEYRNNEDIRKEKWSNLEQILTENGLS